MPVHYTQCTTLASLDSWKIAGAEKRIFSMQYTVESRGRLLIISVSDKPTALSHAHLSDQKNVK